MNEQKNFTINEMNSSDNIQQNTQSNFVAFNTITAACHSLLNTQFTPIDPKPDWFDDLENKLDAAKVIAKEWIDDLGPEMTSKIPQHVVDYASTYSAITGMIVDLAEKHPTAKGKDNPIIIEINDLTEGLKSSVNDILSDIQAMDDRLKAWGDKMQQAHDDLSSGATNIQDLETDLQADINKMNTAISNLHAAIDEQNKAIAYSAMGIGIGIFVMCVGCALALETFGAGLIVAGVGAAAVVGGTVTWAVMQSKINKEFDEIAKDQKELDADKKQLVALKGLDSASQCAINNTTIATQALSEVKTMWKFFEGELEGVCKQLNSAEKDVSIIVKEAYILGAQKEWDEAVKFAEQLIGMDVAVEAKTLSIDSSELAAV